MSLTRRLDAQVCFLNVADCFTFVTSNFRDQSAVTRQCDLVCPLVLHHELAQGRAGRAALADGGRTSDADRRAWRRPDDGKDRDDAGAAPTRAA